MKYVLIDTNILIQREDPQVIPKELQELFKIFSKLNYKIIIHPKSIVEIEKDKNQERRRQILSKIGVYEILKQPPNPEKDQDFIRRIGNLSKSNDLNDAWLLYSVFQNRIDLLITEDRKLLSKANLFDLDNKTFSIKEGLDYFKPYIEDHKIVLPPNIRIESVYNLNLEDPFFDSLKGEYSEFNEWFIKREVQNRRCWTYYNINGTLGALCIYKFENEPLPLRNFPKKKRLKLSTFKVSRTGDRIGELFIKSAIQLAVKQKIEEIYLTTFPTHDYLKSRLIKFGFVKIGINKRNEEIYLKFLYVDHESLPKITSTMNLTTLYYPCIYDGSEISKFLIPIKPQFHDKLFSENLYRRKTLDDYTGKMIRSANTILKAYLTHSSSKLMKPGDIVLFYRSKDKKSITNIGIIERIHLNIMDYAEIVAITAKRSVYHSKELKKMIKKPTTVILFRECFHFKKPVSYDELKNEIEIKGPFQSIRKIKSNIKFNEIIDRSGIDARYFIHQT